ncbi:hypothetical protein Bbelb_024130 [Branchiostoma belcheri]|nr:hypothetical protein Bbelb_024130 [Branchiostoma belcheri]
MTSSLLVYPCDAILGLISAASFQEFSRVEMASKSEVNCPLSEYTKSLPPLVLERYRNKVKSVGIDPFLLSFDQFDPDRLPPVESIDLASYLVLDTSFYTQERFKAFKSLEAYNYVVSGCVESVGGQLRGDKYVVVGKVKRSQSWNSPGVNVWIITTKGGTILSAHCRDCVAGQGECCSHVASILFYVEIYHRVKGQTAPTDLPCSWLPTVPSSAPYARIRDIDFRSAKKLKANLDSMRPVPVVNTEPDQPQGEDFPDISPNDAELEALYQNLDKVKYRPVVLSLVNPYSDSFLPKSIDVPTITDLSDNKYLNMNYHDLMQACEKVDIQLSEIERDAIEEDTRNQAKDGSFFRHRAGRIGASVSKQACCTNPAQPSKSLVTSICYPKLVRFTTAATEHGCKHERTAISEYETEMKSKHTNFKIEPCGLTVHPDYPWLHATPDFVCSCDCCGQGCGEVKCPYCLKDIDFHQYAQRRTACLHLDDDKLRLKKDHQYFYQVQQQLFSTGRKYCDFVVCSVGDKKQAKITMERIYPDLDHWNRVVPKLTHFWRYCILPEILGRWYTQKRDILVEPATTTSTNSVCFCRTTSDSPEVKCSNSTCPISTFHKSCLKISSEVPAKWLCPLCQVSVSSKPQKQTRTRSTAPQKALSLQSVCVCQKTPLQTDKLLECHNNGCESGKFFHLTCINYKRMPNNASTTWVCSDCKRKLRSNNMSSTCSSTDNIPSVFEEEEVTVTGVSVNKNVDRFGQMCNMTDHHYGLIMDPVGWLDCDIIHNAHILLKKIDPSMEGLQRPTLGPCRNFQTVRHPFIQILHTGNSHWVCTSTVRGNDGVVDLYDSLYHNVVQREVEEQVKCLVGDNYAGLRVVAVQQQENGSDCGVFAIAYATCLIHGILPQTVQFIHDRMRGHLANSGMKVCRPRDMEQKHSLSVTTGSNSAAPSHVAGMKVCRPRDMEQEHSLSVTTGSNSALPPSHVAGMKVCRPRDMEQEHSLSVTTGSNSAAPLPRSRDEAGMKVCRPRDMEQEHSLSATSRMFQQCCKCPNSPPSPHSRDEGVRL